MKNSFSKNPPPQPIDIKEDSPDSYAVFVIIVVAFIFFLCEVITIAHCH